MDFTRIIRSLQLKLKKVEQVVQDITKQIQIFEKARDEEDAKKLTQLKK